MRPTIEVIIPAIAIPLPPSFFFIETIPSTRPITYVNMVTYHKQQRQTETIPKIIDAIAKPFD